MMEVVNGRIESLSQLEVVISDFICLIISGRKLKFKARCNLMNCKTGIAIEAYEWNETDNDGIYEKIITIKPDWSSRETFYRRYHFTLLE